MVVIDVFILVCDLALCLLWSNAAIQRLDVAHMTLQEMGSRGERSPVTHLDIYTGFGYQHLQVIRGVKNTVSHRSTFGYWPSSHVRRNSQTSGCTPFPACSASQFRAQSRDSDRPFAHRHIEWVCERSPGLVSWRHHWDGYRSRQLHRQRGYR